MKSIIFCLFSLLFTGLYGCKNTASESQETVIEQKEEIDKTGIEYTSEFVCPMHCKGSGSDEKGECTVCGMDYVMNKDIDHSGHNHDHHDHDHHDHGHEH